MKFTVLLGIFSVILLVNVAAAEKMRRSTEFANQLETKLKTEFEMVIDEFFRFVKQLVVNITGDSEGTIGTTAASETTPTQSPSTEQFPPTPAPTPSAPGKISDFSNDQPNTS